LPTAPTAFVVLTAIFQSVAIHVEIEIAHALANSFTDLIFGQVTIATMPVTREAVFRTPQLAAEIIPTLVYRVVQRIIEIQTRLITAWSSVGSHGAS
jgi:hypothetical protein